MVMHSEYQPLHIMQMNLDPRLDFGHGAPRMSEAAPPNADQVLQHAKWPLCQMLEIENEDEWQVRSSCSRMVLYCSCNLYTF